MSSNDSPAAADSSSSPSVVETQLHARGYTPQFITAIQKYPIKRSLYDVEQIVEQLRTFNCFQPFEVDYLYEVARTSELIYKQAANDILYCRGELANYNYLLLTGSVFIDMNMFLPVTSFGRRYYGQTRRPNECLILEPSILLSIDNNLQSSSTSSHRTSIHSYSSEDISTSSYCDSTGYSGSETMQQQPFNFDGLVESTVDSSEEEDDDYYAESDEGDEELVPKRIILRDAVRECLEKDPSERTESDIQILLEFTQRLTAFNNLTIGIRRALCSVMVFAVVDKANTIVLNHGEELDSWSVVVHGCVEIIRDSEVIELNPGDSFGLPPTMDKFWFEGEMKTKVDDCQFICVCQVDYFRILKQGEDSLFHHKINNQIVLVTELKCTSSISTTSSSGAGPTTTTQPTTTSPIILRGTPTELTRQLILNEYHSSDPTYIEDFLLTYRIFTSPTLLTSTLLEYFNTPIRDRVIRIVLLWVNNHFIDFEQDTELYKFLQDFQRLLENYGLTGQLRLLQIACSAKSSTRTVTITRSTRDEQLPFNIIGGGDYGIFINTTNHICLWPGDELLSINGKLVVDLLKTFEMLKNLTHLVLDVKCNFLGYYECIHSKEPLMKRQQIMSSTGSNHVLKKLTKKYSTKQKFSIKQLFKWNLQQQEEPIVENVIATEKPKITFPENVLKIYRQDHSFKYLLVNKETTVEDVISLCLTNDEDVVLEEYNLVQVCYRDGILKVSRLPGGLDSLAERLPLGARYYLRNTTTTFDEILPDLQRSSTINFLQLNATELALQLTLTDYTIFRRIQSIEFINDLFTLRSTPNLTKFDSLVNKETFWVVTEITREMNTHRRVSILKRFIKIAQECKFCRNYNSMFAIVSGLGHGAVRRLKSSWEKLGKNYIQLFEEMEQLMDPTRNMGKYRTLLSSSSSSTTTTPMIPFYPVIRKDLTFINLGNSTTVDSLINFEKMRMLSKEIRTIIQMSNLPFDTRTNPCLASMNQLTTITTTKGKLKNSNNEFNCKKMYKEMNMIRKIKYYLDNLIVIDDEVILYELSEKCEGSSTSVGSGSV